MRLQLHIGLSSVPTREVLYGASRMRRDRVSINRCRFAPPRPGLLLAVLGGDRHLRHEAGGG